MSEVDSEPRQGHGWLKLVAVAALLFGSGYWFGGGGVETKPTADPHEQHAGDADADTEYYCPMHPDIRQPDFGTCPICGMDLVPALGGGASDLGPRMMSMSPSAKKLAEIQTTRVERKFVDMEIPLVGLIDYDETRVRTIASWVPGRLERLFVDYTGVAVRKGDHLAEMYSPDLYAAQEELIQAVKAVKSLQNSTSEYVREATRETAEAGREKLRLLGLTDAQVAAIEKRGTPEATVQIQAPAAGIVIHKNATEGMYVKTGTPIYTVADLSRVWVMLDAYESDIAWIRYGQPVEVKTEAYGDEIFKGWVSFIDPVLDPRTRSIKVRVVVENPQGKLRPNMFARATIKARIAGAQKVINPDLAGKWISPMHPEVIKDEAGSCDVCGMDLVRAEELGYVTEKVAEAPIVVPTTAVLTTGRRAVAYVEVPGAATPTYQGIEVDLGARAGDYYVVTSGLEVGQKVVTNGSFKIDSALQLMAKPSMMSAGAEREQVSEPEPVSAPSAFLVLLQPVYDAYLGAQEALAKDSAEPALAALDTMLAAAGKVDVSLLSGDARATWRDIHDGLTAATEHRHHQEEIGGLRKIFLRVSELMIRLEKTFGHTGSRPHRLAFCPMANEDRGGEWLQTGDVVQNPYFGSQMLKCGEIRQTFEAKAILSDDEVMAVERLTTLYLALQVALAGDDLPKAKVSARDLAKAVEGLPDGELDSQPATAQMRQDASKLAAAESMVGAREHFQGLSADMETLVRLAGSLPTLTVRKAYCPMAFDNKGAHWLQESDTVANPYFGAAMFRCGEVQETLSSPAETQEEVNED